MKERGERVCSAAELARGANVVHGAGRDRVVVFRGEEGELFAVDDVCPHQGYPLSKGQVSGDVVTCCYHNFKFNMRSGACLIGDEDVGAHRIEERDGDLFLLRTLKDRAATRETHRKGLREALHDRRMGQVAREVVRLLDAGANATDVLLEAVRFDAKHAEYGLTHTLALTVDLLPLLHERDGLEQVYPILQAMDIASEGSVRRQRRARPEPAVIEDASTAIRELAAVFEAEDVDRGEALVRGLWASGMTLEALRATFLELTSTHLLSYGHGLIYVTKAFQLLQSVSREDADIILGALFVHLATATRYDLLPRWQWMSRYVADPIEGSERFAAHELEAAAVSHSFGGASRDDAMERLSSAAERPEARAALAAALSVVAAEQFSRFDPAVDAADDIENGWLDATHVMTFVDAVQTLLSEPHDPAIARRFLMQAGAFILNTKALARVDNGAPAEAARDLDGVWRLVEAGDGAAAFHGTRAYLEDGGDLAALLGRARDYAMSDTLVRPIFVAHVIKMAEAVGKQVRTLRAYDSESFWMPAAAFVRWLALPKRERSLRRVGYEAIRLVRDGKVPRSYA